MGDLSVSDVPPRRIGHLDMDAFYAAVEQLDEPAYRGRPVIVGGLGPRGVVSTASYEAREFGVRSAMPMAVARRRCPNGIYVCPRFSRYAQISETVLSIVKQYSGAIEPISLDEAFFDLTKHGTTYASAGAVAHEIKRRVQADTKITCSVGVGGSRFLAKIASELSKPDGFLVIEPADVQRTLDPLPVGAIWGVGDVTERHLRSLGLLRVRDLRTADPALLEREFGLSGVRLLRLARGQDDSPVGAPAEARSISREVTFPADECEPERIEREVRALARLVAEGLRRERLLCRTVRVKVRYPDFRTVSRQMRLSVGTDAQHVIEAIAAHLLRERVDLDEHGVRLLGVGVGRLSETTARQLPLF